MPALTDQIRTTVLTGFDDPAISPAVWSDLLRKGETDGVNLTWQWQKCWWEAFGRGRLLLIAVHRNDDLVAIAPLFADAGMVFNICPEDRLDFVGDVSDPCVIDSVLRLAQEEVEEFSGFRFYFIPDSSGTGRRLQQAARRMGLECFQEASLPRPWMDIKNNPEAAERTTRKKSLLRHERYFEREGVLQVDFWRDADAVSAHLEHFFDQHVARRAATPHPSLFEQPHQRRYYRQLTRMAGSQGWLRFTRVCWDDRPIAYHFGLRYCGDYVWAIPSFDIELADRSPGEVLLRQVLMAAIQEGAAEFDFGPGDEAYKHRFATDVTQLVTWGLYPVSNDRGAR